MSDLNQLTEAAYRRLAKSPSKGESAPLEACENCGAVIGRLETAHVWGQHVVCTACHNRLAAAHHAPATAGGGDTLGDDDLVDMGAQVQSVYFPFAAPVPQPPPPPPAVVMPYAQPGYPPRAKYVDNLWPVRLLLLLGSILFWPLILAWLALGVYHLIMKFRS